MVGSLCGATIRASLRDANKTKWGLVVRLPQDKCCPEVFWKLSFYNKPKSLQRIFGIFEALNFRVKRNIWQCVNSYLHWASTGNVFLIVYPRISLLEIAKRKKILFFRLKVKHLILSCFHTLTRSWILKWNSIRKFISCISISNCPILKKDEYEVPKAVVWSHTQRLLILGHKLL